MTAAAWPVVAVAALATLAGALLLGRRWPRSRADPQPAPVHLGPTFATLAVLAAASHAGSIALAVTLAALSAWMLHGMLAHEPPRSSRECSLRLACYACVPLQYALVLGAPAAMPVVLPLVATLALPLFAVVAGDLTALGDRLALRFQAVMLSVYALSFAALADANAPLVVGSALAGSLALDGLRALLRRRTPHRSPRMRAAVALLGSVAATGAGGATLAPLVSQPAVAAALTAAAAALCGALGTLTLDAMAHDRPAAAARCGVPARLEAIAFSAPLLWALGS